MKKKLLVLLLIITVAAFVFTGCTPPTPSEGEGEGEVEGVVIEIGDYYKAADGRIFVPAGNNTITVTFPAPVDDVVKAIVYPCQGGVMPELSKSMLDEMIIIGLGGSVVYLIPNADKTVWTGSGFFGCCGFDCEDWEEVDECSAGCLECCTSLIQVTAGVCENDICVGMPVIVDHCPPYLDGKVRFVDCGDPCDECATSKGAYMEWKTFVGGTTCDPEDCCGDDCSGVGEWVMVIDDDVCAGPCDEVTGVGCPVEGVSDCCFLYPKDTGEQNTVIYPVKFEIEDKVGNKTKASWNVGVTLNSKDPLNATIKVDGYTVGTITGEGNVTDWFNVPISGVCLPY